MLDILSTLPITLPLTFFKGFFKGRNIEKRRQAADTMWKAVLDLNYALPLEARCYMDLEIKGADYSHHKIRTSELLPVTQDGDDRFCKQWVLFHDELNRQRPYLDTKLYDLCRDYSGLLQHTLTVAKYHTIYADFRFLWEEETVRFIGGNLLSRREMKRFSKCAYGRDFLRILEDAICEQVQKL